MRIITLHKRLFFLFITLFITSFLSACFMPEKKHYPLHISLQNPKLPDLILIEDFFDNKKENGQYKISPDGQKIAWVETTRGTKTVHFKNIEDNEIDYISTFRGRISNFYWAMDSRRIFVYYGKKGKENYNIGVYDTEAPGKRPYFVVEFKGHMKFKKRAFLQENLINDHEKIFVRHNDRDLTCYDLYKMSIRKRKEELIAENPGDVREWITDNTGKLHARVRHDEKKRIKFLEAYEEKDKSWKKVIRLNIEDSFNCIGFDKTTELMWVLSNRKTDKLALCKFSLKTGEETIVYEHSKVDIDGYARIRETQEPYILYLEPDYPTVHFVNKEMEKKFQPFLSRMKQDNLKFFFVKSSDNQAQKFTLVAYTDKEWAYYYFDTTTGKVDLLYYSKKSEYRDMISEMKPISFKSRDGLEINGFLTLPLNIPPKNLPMVLLAHGGPWSRYKWGNNKKVQILANRGYAVLQVNFRGSQGYGKKFIEAGIGEYGGKMVTDLIDGANWAITQQIADPQKIAIYGESYGGYATLVALTTVPDFFACGIDVFGPSDLESLIERKPVWWKLGMHRYYKYIGDPNTPEGLKKIKEISPIYKIDAIKKPILVIYGSEDQRVQLKQSSTVIEKLTKLKKEYESYSFPDEGHGFHGKNRITYYEIIEGFLAKHLGGRVGE